MNDYSSKETTEYLYKKKNPHTNWEVNFAIHIIHKGLVNNLHKELLQINKEKNLKDKQAKD